MIPAAFYEIAELALSLGVERPGGLPGCWEYQVDDDWHIAVNGHGHAATTEDGLELAPCTVAVTCDGLPAGILTLTGGTIASYDGRGEAELIAALQAAGR